MFYTKSFRTFFWIVWHLRCCMQRSHSHFLRFIYRKQQKSTISLCVPEINYVVSLNQPVDVLLGYCMNCISMYDNLPRCLRSSISLNSLKRVLPRLHQLWEHFQRYWCCTAWLIKNATCRFSARIRMQGNLPGRSSNPSCGPSGGHKVQIDSATKQRNWFFLLVSHH